MTQLTPNLADNLAILREIVKETYPESTIMQDLCLAQAILESRLLEAPSSLAMSPNNNLFGIKGQGTAGTVYLWTHEWIKGKEIQIKAGFAKNLSLNDSIAQHRHIMELDRYKRVWESKTFEDAANMIRICGYATDPEYSKSLIVIYNQHIKL